MRQYDLPQVEGLDTLLQGNFELLVTNNPSRAQETTLILEATPENQKKILDLATQLQMLAGSARALEERVTLPDLTESVEYVRDPNAPAGEEKEVGGIRVSTLSFPGKENQKFIYGFLDDKVVVSDSETAFAQVVAAFRQKPEGKRLPSVVASVPESNQWFYLDLAQFKTMASFFPLQGLRQLQGASKQDRDGEYLEIWLDLQN